MTRWLVLFAILASTVMAYSQTEEWKQLFDGKDLSQWHGGEKWEIKDGYAITREADIKTKAKFGDCQLHIEWATPAEVHGSSQARGNSGVLLMGRYEIQVLDSFDNPTYADGARGARASSGIGPSGATGESNASADAEASIYAGPAGRSVRGCGPREAAQPASCRLAEARRPSTPNPARPFARRSNSRRRG